MKDWITVCDYCGCPDIHVNEWRTVNTNEYVCEGPCDSPFCAGCQDETRTTTYNVPDALMAFGLALVWSDAYFVWAKSQPPESDARWRLGK